MRRMSVIVGVGLVVLLVGYAALQVYLSRQAHIREDGVVQGFVSGTFACLPGRENESVDECAAGVRGDDGTYYAIDFGLLSQGMPAFVEGDRVSAEGIITPIENLSTDYWNRFDVSAIFSVTNSLVVEKPEVEVAPATTTATTTESSDESLGIIDSWVWTQTQLQSGEVVVPNNPQAFVLTFGSDGSYGSKTDCNTMGGTYVVDGEVVSLTPPFSTKMYCEGSQELVYAQQLQLIQSYSIAGNELIFNLNRDFGTMLFERQ